MINVKETMEKVLPELKEGINDIKFYLKPECQDEWSDKYAIVKGLYYEEGFDQEYFDHDRLVMDYEEMVREKFPGCEVKFYWRSQEIEVMRK